MAALKNYAKANSNKDKTDLNSTQNIVHPEWEIIDPTPDVHHLFANFNRKFFSGQLSCVELEWSKRMYQCAGICYSRRNRLGMACVIRLSEPLLKLRSRKDLIETLIHEMIHAWNFIRGISEENGGHGQNFLSKMYEINRVAGTNISVYHTFRDEVELYKTHWWRCDGVCQNRSPFFGYVKRTSNRKPSANDRWWAEHQRTCGGNFIKVKEPQKTKEKENKSKTPVSKKPKLNATSPGSDIRKFFKPKEKEQEKVPDSPQEIIEIPSSGGFRLGGDNGGKSRLLDQFETIRAKKRKIPENRFSFETKIYSPDRTLHDNLRNELDGEDDDIIFIDDEYDDSIASTSFPVQSTSNADSSEFCNCPVCSLKIKKSEINQHLDDCLQFS